MQQAGVGQQGSSIHSTRLSWRSPLYSWRIPNEVKKL